MRQVCTAVGLMTMTLVLAGPAYAQGAAESYAAARQRVEELRLHVAELEADANEAARAAVGTTDEALIEAARAAAMRAEQERAELTAAEEQRALAALALVEQNEGAAPATPDTGQRVGSKRTDQAVQQFTPSAPIFRCSTATPAVVPTAYCDVNNPNADLSACVSHAPRNSRFVVLERSDDYSLVSFLPWSNQDSAVHRRFYGSDADVRYWCVDADLMPSRSEPVSPEHSIPGRWVSSAIIVPYKLRPGWGSEQFDFVSDISLSVGVGYLWPLSRGELGVVVAVGPSLIQIPGAGEGGSTASRGAFSFAVGATASFSGVDLSLLIGVDLLARRGTIEWDHHARPWIGIALGVSVFSGQAEASARAPSQTPTDSPDADESAAGAASADDSDDAGTDTDG